MANSLETTLKYSDLLLLYQNLLSDTQKEILDDYFSYNLSISEIAENREISRSAVEDAIKKGKKKLDQLEKEIGNLQVLNIIYQMKSDATDEKVIASLEEIERIMKHGIWILKW